MARTVRQLAIPTILMLASCACTPKLRLFEPEGTLTQYVREHTSAQIYAPRDARAQKVFFPKPEQSLIYPGESDLRTFFDSHGDDFANAGAVRRALAFFAPRFQELIRSGRYLDPEIDQAACSLFSRSDQPCELDTPDGRDFALDAKAALRVVSAKTDGPDELLDAWACALLPREWGVATGEGPCARFGWIPEPRLKRDWFTHLAPKSDDDKRALAMRELRFAVDQQSVALRRDVESILREREDLFKAAVDLKTAIASFHQELDTWFGGDEQKKVFEATDPEDRSVVATILTTTVVDKAFPKPDDADKKFPSQAAIRGAVRLSALKARDLQTASDALAGSIPFTNGIGDSERRREQAMKLLALVLKQTSGDKRLLEANDALTAISAARLAPRFNSDDALKLGRPRLEAFGLALRAGTDYEEAKKAIFDNDEFGSLLNIVSGAHDRMTAFSHELVSQFGTSIATAVSQDAQAAADYEYWWLTFYPKAVPIGPRDWKGTSIVQIDFPTAALPESQFRRWLLDYYTDPKTRMLNAIDEQLELMKYDGTDTSLASFLLGQLRAELLKAIPSIEDLNRPKPEALRASTDVAYADICDEESFYKGDSTFATEAGLTAQVKCLSALPDKGGTPVTPFAADSALMKRLHYHPLIQIEKLTEGCAKAKSLAATLKIEHPLAWFEQELLIFAELLRWGGLPKNVDYDFGDKNWAKIDPNPTINRDSLTADAWRKDFGKDPLHLFLPDPTSPDAKLLHPEFRRNVCHADPVELTLARQLHRYFLAIRALARTTLYERTDSRIYYLLENQFGTLNAKLQRALPSAVTAGGGLACGTDKREVRCLIVNGVSNMRKRLEAQGNSAYPGSVILPDLKRDWSRDVEVQSVMLLIEAVLGRGRMESVGASSRETATQRIVADWLKQAWDCMSAAPDAVGCETKFAGADLPSALRPSVLDKLSLDERARVTAELLERRLDGLWKGLAYICRIDRAVPYQSLTSKKAYEDFVSVGKPQVQRNVEVINMLPSSRDDLVAQSVAKGGSLMSFALAGRGAANVGTVNTHERGHSGSRSSTTPAADSSGTDATATKDAAKNTALEEFARRFETILNYKLGGGASADARLNASLSHAYAYSKSKDYLNAVITAAGETDNFAKWIVRRGSSQTSDPTHNGYPNGSVPFYLLVRIPRAAMLTDWDGAKYVLFNSAYTLQNGRKFHTTRYPFLYEVSDASQALEQDGKLNALGGLIRLDATDRISYDDIKARLDDEADFVAAARATQQATLKELMDSIKSDEKLTAATKDVIPETQAEKDAAKKKAGGSTDSSQNPTTTPNPPPNGDSPNPGDQ